MHGRFVYPGTQNIQILQKKAKKKKKKMNHNPYHNKNYLHNNKNTWRVKYKTTNMFVIFLSDIMLSNCIRNIDVAQNVVWLIQRAVFVFCITRFIHCSQWIFSLSLQ